MPNRSRRAVLFAVLVFCAGCTASSNKGRIEGRWKIVSDDPKCRDVLLAFGDDGRVTMERPTAAAITWRYKLLGSDAADFYELSPDATD